MDPDQTESSEASLSGSLMFSKETIFGLSRTNV